MRKTLVIVGHPNISASRINASWMNALLEDGRATVRLLTEHMVSSHFDVPEEQKVLESHDRVVLQFPFHWYSAPTILKQWLEEVLQRGWSYGPNGDALVKKELALAISTWSTATDYSIDGRYGRTIEDLTSPFEVTATRMGMVYRAGHFLHGVGKVNDQELVKDGRQLVNWVNRA